MRQSLNGINMNQVGSSISDS